MRGTIRKRRGGYQIQVSLGRDPLTGARRFLSRQVNGTKSEAEDLLAKLIVEAAGGGRRVPKTMTVSQLLDEWLAVTDLASSTREQAAWRARRYVTPALGRKPLRKLGADDLDLFYRALLERGGTDGRPLAPATVRRVHADLSAALALAVRWGWLPENPTARTRPPSAPTPRPAAPTPVEVRALMDVAAVDDPTLAVFIRVAAATGARRGEVCALRWSDIVVDGDRAIVSIHSAVDAHGRLKSTKTGDERRLSIDPTTTALLLEHRRAAATIDPDAFVFTYRRGSPRPWLPGGVTHRFIKVRRAADLEHVQLRQLRHYVGTYLGAAGVPVKAISGRLGHRRTSTTQNVYTSWLEAPDVAAADTLGRLLDGTEG